MSLAGQTIASPAAADNHAVAELARLRSASAVRERCNLVRCWVADGRSPHFALDERRLPDVADYVAEVTQASYPDLDIPPHSRWRHFSAGGIERWDHLVGRLDAANAIERARAAVDLATMSVLLDAGAGDHWRYREQETGLVLARSEGLAVASISMFAAGAFSSDRAQPLQAEAGALKAMDTTMLAQGFQVSADNALIGLDRRAALLRKLGRRLGEQPELYGRTRRPGHLVDFLLHSARNGRVAAPELLNTLLESLSSIWPSGLVVGGVNVGDGGRHPAIRTSDATDGIVPFHKLSQWLTYSLIEPLAMAGLTMVEVDGLTALPEYRNGGLLIDLGVIVPRQSIEGPQDVLSELVVEWRALTVALMDELLGLVRARLGLGAAFTMPHLLQGGTWSAGRKIARALRPPDGPSPISLVSDGTLF